jgi:tetratricopeptide (TPR) repeat protein
MLDEWSFWMKALLKYEGRPFTLEEVEKYFLEELEKSGYESESALWNLAILYSKTNRQQIAIGYIERLMDKTDDPEDKGLYFLKMGQFMEQIGDYDSAITFYRQAFSLEPTNSELWYYINNNLGYCLNHFGKHQEAERYCRTAIKVDPQRHNAYKNLGISLEGQGQYSEAVEWYVMAIRANAEDPRALLHLENLLVKHGQVLFEIPDMNEKLQECREKVKRAKEIINWLDRKSGGKS